MYCMSLWMRSMSSLVSPVVRTCVSIRSHAARTRCRQLWGVWLDVVQGSQDVALGSPPDPGVRPLAGQPLVAVHVVRAGHPVPALPLPDAPVVV